MLGRRVVLWSLVGAGAIALVTQACGAFATADSTPTNDAGSDTSTAPTPVDGGPEAGPAILDGSSDVLVDAGPRTCKGTPVIDDHFFALESHWSFGGTQPTIDKTVGLALPSLLAQTPPLSQGGQDGQSASYFFTPSPKAICVEMDMHVEAEVDMFGPQGYSEILAIVPAAPASGNGVYLELRNGGLRLSNDVAFVVVSNWSAGAWAHVVFRSDYDPSDPVGRSVTAKIGNGVTASLPQTAGANLAKLEMRVGAESRGAAPAVKVHIDNLFMTRE
jgi:hypothetical protein